MSALASLVLAYDRMASRGEVPAFGYSQEKIGFLISLNQDGTLPCPPIDLRQSEGRKSVAPPMLVPQPVKRTSGVAPNFLWDKSAYVLGVTAGEGKRTGRNMQHLRMRIENGLLKHPTKDCRPSCISLKHGCRSNSSNVAGRMT